MSHQYSTGQRSLRRFCDGAYAAQLVHTYLGAEKKTKKNMHAHTSRHRLGKLNKSHKKTTLGNPFYKYKNTDSRKTNKRFLYVNDTFLFYPSWPWHCTHYLIVPLEGNPVLIIRAVEILEASMTSSFPAWTFSQINTYLRLQRHPSSWQISLMCFHL